MDSFLSQMPKLGQRKDKRLGRGYGSGKGAKSTKGTTRHQKSRENIPLWFEGGQNRMIKKYPLLRGKGKNKSVQQKYLIINLYDLEKIEGEKEISIETLIKHNIVTDKAFKLGVKLLGTGEVTKAIHVKLPASKTAKAKIEKAGGQVV